MPNNCSFRPRIHATQLVSSMSEYWVSTPKYWCKFCKTYVRDTTFEKRQHESTPKHQGNIQRSLRTMHKEHEREDRDKARAQAEVARLNSIVSGAGGASKTGASGGGILNPAGSSTAAPRQAASAEERKRQMKQLADMGVAVPEEYRADIALAGDWQTLSTRKINPVKDEDADTKPDAQSIGVRKRKHESAEEEEEAGETVVRRGWGSTTREYPGNPASVEDIGALLKKSEPVVKKDTNDADAVPGLKKEDSVEDLLSSTVKETPLQPDDAAVKPDPDSETAAPVFFKKRKGKVLKAG